MNIVKIDLEKALMPNDDFLSGRLEGADFRKMYNIDEIDNDPNTNVVIRISEKIIGINISFFLGLLSISINKCGSVENFYKKFSFEIDEKYKHVIEKDIAYNMEVALSDTNIEAIFD